MSPVSFRWAMLFLEREHANLQIEKPKHGLPHTSYDPGFGFSESHHLEFFC